MNFRCASEKPLKKGHSGGPVQVIESWWPLLTSQCSRRFRFLVEFRTFSVIPMATSHQARARPELMWMALPRFPILLPAASCNLTGQQTRGKDELALGQEPMVNQGAWHEGSAGVRQFEVPNVMVVIDRGERKVHRALKRKQGCHDSRSNHVSLLLLWLRILPINE